LKDMWYNLEVIYAMKWEVAPKVPESGNFEGISMEYVRL